jgi:cellulose synthase/poly-beta-1,6-N-acetylglucosamine synthase-like glycosyltransferase
VQLPDMVDMDAACNKVGAVVIGRNEGERLRRCLQSLQGTVRHVVYVDSGSTDGSVALAAAFGATVFELDMRIPFNAGRARNEGVRRLGELHPELRYVLFVDGDCEVIRTWPAQAAHFLDAHPDVAVVSGRLRERDPQRSVYNMLAANEWKAHPIGAALACGGNATMRIQALSDVGGYRLDLQSGEEPELCLRLRAAGWLIWFLPEDQAVHDAAMTRFSQFWRRSMRSGYGCMQGLLLHGGPPEFHCLRAVMSASFWALLVPLATLLLLPWLGVAALLLLLIYPLQMLRIALRDRRSREDYWRWGLFAVLIKFPNLQGQLQCLLHQFQRRKARLIEYKL